MKGIESILNTGGKDNPIVHVEYMDTKNFNKSELFPILTELYRNKYSNRQPKVIITSDDYALDFMLEHRDALFPGVPVVFCGANNFKDARLNGQTGYTGVVEAIDMFHTVRIALMLHPDAKHLVAVADTTRSGLINRQAFLSMIEEFKGQYSIIDLHDWTAEELAQELKILPKDSVIFNLSFFRDNLDTLFTAVQGNQFIKEHSPYPVYSFWDFSLGTGVVGGMLVSGVLQGQEAGEMALKILKGTPVKDVPIVRESPNMYMFDHLALVEAGIDTARLPENSLVINKPQSFYDNYKREIYFLAGTLGCLIILIIIMAANILQRRKAQAELMSIFHNTQAGILHLKGGRIVYRANQRMADILGYDTPSELHGKNVKDFHIDVTHYTQFGKDFYDTLVSSQSVTTEYQLKRKDGTPVWVALSGKAMDQVHPPNLNSGVVWIIQDISERKQAEEDLEALNRELESKVQIRTLELKEQADELEAVNRRLLKFDELKSAFLNTVSHDLRTPLTSIRGFVRLIQRDFDKTFSCNLGGCDRKTKKIGNRITANLNILVEESNRLTRLINDFLDLSKIESGGMQWRDQSLNLGTTISKIAHLLAIHFQANKDIQLRVDVPETLPTIHADPDRIIQILDNLVGNASKFTEKGYISIRAFASSPKKVVVEVKDTGIGIPEEELPHIFDKFHQVETDDTLRDTIKGTGLGLAICKEIVDHYKGEMWVTSEANKGSTFAFSLPTEAADQ